MAEYTDEQLDRIDVLIRQHIFGWGGPGALAVWDDGFAPTRDRGQAMLVLEWLCDDEIVVGPGKSGGFFVGTIDWLSEEVSITSEAATLPLAICLAALDMAEVDIPA